MIIVVSFASAILFALACVLITAAALGKALNVNPSRTLDGVDENVREALWDASLAANSHNAQMWSVTVHPNRRMLQIKIDSERTLAIVDPALREAYISLGCYLESICFAFEAHGMNTDIAYARAADGVTVTVMYSEQNTPTVSNEKCALLRKRHTDKSAYSKQRIAQKTVNVLLAKYENTACYQSGESRFEYLRKTSYDAVTMQASEPAYREELSKWMRFSDREAAEKLDGITAEMIGLTGIVKTFYYWTTNHESALKDGFAKQGINTAQKQLNACGAFFVITGGNTPLDLIDVGRKTQALWFDCTRENISLQPFSAILETQPFASTVQDQLETSLPVQMILRAGYVKNYGFNCGLRRSLSEYVHVLA